MRLTVNNRCVSLLLLMFLIGGNILAAPPQDRIAVLPEKSLRALAIKTVMPAYPSQSRRGKKEGVAVAQLIINEGGDVGEVKVLEAPDKLIERAVINALRQWKFQRPKLDSTGEPIRMKGKITFYYVIERGKASVKDPT